MSSVQVRPFRRDDRDQLTRLVNAHAEAVVPGMSVSVNSVLGSLGRQPGEFIEDPWVSDRITLVAEQRDRAAGPWPGGAPLSRDQRLPLVRRARPGGGRLHRG
jgi:hypothetical protein